MPNIKSAKKRVAVSAAKTAQNRMVRSSLRTTIKKVKLVSLEGDAAQTQQSYRETQKKIDQAVAKGLIHKNKAAHLKGQLSKLAK